MRRTPATPLLIGGLFVLHGCQSPGPTLEEVIRDYLDLRAQRGAQQCECYQLYVDVEDPDLTPFASEQECLASYPPSTGAAVDCIKAVLESSTYDAEGRVNIMQCYNTALQESTDCFTENTAECSPLASSHCTESDLANNSQCQGQLSDDEISTIIQCAMQ
jgi:hypothetical protein